MWLISSLIVVLINSAILCNAECPRGILKSGVSKNESEFIVNEHNRLRIMLANGQVKGQPRAINLKRMHWDDKLAEAAQNLSNTCSKDHLRPKDPRWWSIGQNIGIAGRNSGEANWAGTIESWWKEHRFYKYPAKVSKEVVGHYRQMAWHDTIYIGCGFTHAPLKAGYKQQTYVCNYAPTGNIQLDDRSGIRPPYETGVSGCENLC